MALDKSRTPREAPRRVSLTRPGSKGAANAWKEAPVPKKPSVVLETARTTVPALGKAGLARLLVFLCASTVFVSFVGLVSFGCLYGYRYMTRTDHFQLRHITIQGNSRLSAEMVREQANLREGANLLDISLASVERNVSSIPWVQKASVTRMMPDRLVITIKERDPAFWRLKDGQLHYTDSKGTFIAPVAMEQFSSMPTLEVEQGADNMAQALPDLLRSLQAARLPLDLARVSQIRLTSANAVELLLEDSGLTITVGLEEWLANLDRLGVVLSDLQERKEIADVKNIRAQGAHVWVEKHSPVLHG